MLALVVGSLSATGCLIAEAPSYGEPRQTVPVIDDLSVSPPPSLFLYARTGEDKPFGMKVRSEDAGESLIAAWVVDYRDVAGAVKRELPLGAAQEVPPRPADQPKTLSPHFVPNGLVTKGCHSLTLLVMHESSYNVVTGLPIAEAFDDVAAITWFVHVETEGAGEAVPCPTQ
jgi:hypothetical protein